MGFVSIEQLAASFKRDFGVSESDEFDPVLDLKPRSGIWKPTKHYHRRVPNPDSRLTALENNKLEPEKLDLIQRWKSSDWVVFHGQDSVLAAIKKYLPEGDFKILRRKIADIIRLEGMMPHERWYKESPSVVKRATLAEGLRLAQLNLEKDVAAEAFPEIGNLVFYLVPESDEFVGKENNQGGDWGDIWVYDKRNYSVEVQNIFEAKEHWGAPDFVIDEKSWQPDTAKRVAGIPTIPKYTPEILDKRINQSSLLPLDNSLRKARTIDWVLGNSYCSDHEHVFILGPYISVRYLYQFGHNRGNYTGNKESRWLPIKEEYSINTISLLKRMADQFKPEGK